MTGTEGRPWPAVKVSIFPQLQHNRVIPGEPNEKGKDWSGQALSQGAEYVCMRRYPPAPNRAVMIYRLRKGSDSYIYLHLPYIYPLTGFGPSLALSDS